MSQPQSPSESLLSDEHMRSLGTSSIRTDENLSYFIQQKLNFAVQWVNKYGIVDEPSGHGRSEHHITRLIFLIFSAFSLFQTEDWNIVPQYRTHSRAIPDIVLETFHLDMDKTRKGLFIPRVFIEVKVVGSTEDPINQLLSAIRHNYSTVLSSGGYLIGVEGFNWTIMEYQFYYPENANTDTTEPNIILHNFYENPYNMERGGRPEPSQTYTGRDSINIQENVGDIKKALNWIKENPKSRDFIEHKRGANRLPVSHTTSTLRGYEGFEITDFEWIKDLIS